VPGMPRMPSVPNSSLVILNQDWPGQSTRPRFFEFSTRPVIRREERGRGVAQE